MPLVVCSVTVCILMSVNTDKYSRPTCKLELNKYYEQVDKCPILIGISIPWRWSFFYISSWYNYEICSHLHMIYVIVVALTSYLQAKLID